MVSLSINVSLGKSNQSLVSMIQEVYIFSLGAFWNFDSI